MEVDNEDVIIDSDDVCNNNIPKESEKEKEEEDIVFEPKEVIRQVKSSSLC